jgi:plasmid maintenance system antidote protein VapI
VKGERASKADTALRLRRYFKMSAQFWLNLGDDGGVYST